MRIILDENLPKPPKGIFPNHSVTTVQEQGLAGTVNGALLARLAGVFDVLSPPTRISDTSRIFPVGNSRFWNFRRIDSRCYDLCFPALLRQSIPSFPRPTFSLPSDLRTAGNRATL